MIALVFCMFSLSAYAADGRVNFKGSVMEPGCQSQAYDGEVRLKCQKTETALNVSRHVGDQNIKGVGKVSVKAIDGKNKVVTVNYL